MSLICPNSGGYSNESLQTLKYKIEIFAKKKSNVLNTWKIVVWD